MPEKAPTSEKESLILRMKQDPADEEAKRLYEAFLSENDPECVELQLLRLERELASSYLDQAKFDRLVDGYVAFRTEHSTFFWDRRGCIEYLNRTFKVWLVSFSESRRFAVELALKMRHDIALDSLTLPAVIQDGKFPDSARSTKESVIGFVQRYRGPSSLSPDLKAEELVVVVAPSFVDQPL